MHRWLLFAFTMALALVVACGGDDDDESSTEGEESDAGGGGEASVEVLDFEFEPVDITVDAGDTVSWTNNGASIHTVTSDDGLFDTGPFDPGEEFSFTFEEAGEYDYTCTLHPLQMTGTIIVR